MQIVHKGVGNAVALQFSSTIFSDDPSSLPHDDYEKENRYPGYAGAV